ncbi:MAG: hypothetical protein QM788_10665 [Roseateles sp.]|uniref:hypothetical protein n=1 Tax=Roseateles sp. TaxID=1971397 RepID=UPI0039E80256
MAAMGMVRRMSTGNRWSGATVGILAVAIVLAVVGGLAAALGAILPIAMLSALLIGVAVIVSPRLHIVLATLVALVVTGVLEFFASFGQANWLSSLIVGSMLITVVARIAGGRAANEPLGSLMPLVVVYLLTLGFSSVVNQISFAQAMVGVRGYVPYIGVAALLIWGGLKPETGQLLFKILVGIALLQVPFGLYQSLVVGPWRVAQAGAIGRADEAVVGTFGGNVLTGGYTGEMASFLVMVMVFVTALRRDRLMSTPVVVGIVACLLVPILLAETKVTLVLIPVLFVVAFLTDLRRNPKFAFTAVVAGGIAFSVIAVTYYIKYWASGDAGHDFGYSFDPNFMVTPDHRGRVGTIVHWYQMNVQLGSIFGALIGHGVGSSIEGSFTIGMGSAVRQYGLGLDAHAMSRLLWDGGIICFVLFASIGVRTFWISWKLANGGLEPGLDRAAATFCAAASLSMVLMLPYQMSVLGGSAMQFIFWFTVGYTEMLRRRCLGTGTLTSIRGRAGAARR